MTQSAVLQEVATPILRRDDLAAIATLTLDQPARRNALSEAMLDALTESLAAIAADPSVRVVVIAATGTVFSSGHDLKQLAAHRSDADGGRAYFADIMARCSRVMQAIGSLPQPVVASVEGLASAAGCQLVASCDLAVAGAAARFCTPGVDIGLFCSTPMVALSRNVATKHAMEMLLLGEAIDVETAWRFGLINRVVTQGTALKESLALAVQLAAKSAHTLKIGKQAFYRQREQALASAYTYASEVMVTNLLAGDATEGIDAFLQKRRPEWNER